MTAALDRQAFFNAVRLNPFPGHLTPPQVTGMEAILDACPIDTLLEHLAYDLGTCPIETGWTMLPIKEKGGAAYFAKMYDIRGDRPAKARELGNVNPGDGIAFCGRGYVQLTGRANYRKATQRLRALGLLVAGQDLETNPDLAMHPDVAAAVLFIGTREGWFTGKKLTDYLGGGKADWKGARRIINGQDRADEIALHAQAFAAALKKAGYAAGAFVTKFPVPPVTVAPAPPLAAPAPRNSGLLTGDAMTRVEPTKLPATPPAGPTVQTGSLGAWLKSLFSKKAA